MFFLFVIAIISLCHLWLRHRYSYWERRGVPGPRPVYIFGNLLKQLILQEHISLAYQRWYNTYNNVPYVGFYKLLQPAVMIRDPELQREILVKAFMNFQTNDVTNSDGDELLKSNPFFVTGEEWRQGRALLASDGPRMCTGMHLAMFNFKMGLFQLIRHFDVKLHPNNKPFELHPMSFFNIPKDGFKLTLTPRKTSV